MIGYIKKPLVAVMLIMLFVASCLGVSVSAEEGVTVYVTVANGTLKLARERVTVTDADGDGRLTVNDALLLAHEEHFEGGAAKGYSSEKTEYGISLTKLWGNESGNFGYYLNNESPQSLADEVKNGDSVSAYCYTDTENFSDTYTFFDVSYAEVKSGEVVEVTLYSVSFDENWALVKKPLQDAEITVDGKKTSIITNENGKARIYLDISGDHVISAISSSSVIVPPVCAVSVEASSAETNDHIMTVFIIVAVAVIVVIVVVFGKKKYDK